MLSLKSPAKINLFLRIIRRRPDGYHELASLFQAIDLCDEIRIAVAEDSAHDLFTCSDPTLPTDSSNLVIKAVELFRRKTNTTKKFSIHLKKQIPQQAGLGGGSSNAATTLWALNALCGHHATESELSAWGSEIGSDVSFFLSNGTAYCTGRGEILLPLDPLKNSALWVIKPHEGLSTPQVYGKLKVEELSGRDPEEALASFLSGSPTYFNDLEQPAFSVMPRLALLKQQLLDAGFSDVLMSGSGSSFFCMGDGAMPPLSRCKVFKAQFLNRSCHTWY